MSISSIGSLLIIFSHEFACLFVLLVHLSYVVLRMNYLECIPTFCRVCVRLFVVYIFVFFSYYHYLVNISCIKTA